MDVLELDKNDKILTPLVVIPHHLAASSNLGPSLDAITRGVYSPHPPLFIFPQYHGEYFPLRRHWGLSFPAATSCTAERPGI